MNNNQNVNINVSINMLRCILITAVMFTLCYSVSAQKIKNVLGTYTYYAPETESLRTAKEKALRGAQIEAIGREFGKTISEHSYQILSDNGEDFYQEGLSMVRGEWIETVGNPAFEPGFYENGFIIKCTVMGKAREVTASKADLDVKVLCNDPNSKYERADFKNGEKIYLSFKSPVNGFVSVYLYDKSEKTVACLLPYRRESGEAVAVTHDKPYVFFSKTKDKTSQYVNEYIMTCDDESALNTLYVVFSKNSFSKATTTDDGRRTSLRSMTLEKFNAWLTKSRAQDKDMQVIPKILTITPN